MQQYLIVILIVGLPILGIVIFLLLKKPFRKILNLFKERAPLVKKYWKLVLPLLALTAVAYVSIILWVEDRTDMYVSLVGQVSGLALAVIAGYIAFAELGESRFEKLYDSGLEGFRKGEGHLRLAQIRIEEAHAIKPKDLSVLANLLELYIITGAYDKFENKLGHYRRNIVEESEEVALLYLIALKEIVQDHPKDAKEKLKDVIQFVKNHPHSRNNPGWRNDELKASDTYKDLSTDSKTLADNVLRYINDELGEQEEQFIQGDYLLKKK